MCLPCESYLLKFVDDIRCGTAIHMARPDGAFFSFSSSAMTQSPKPKPAQGTWTELGE